MTDAAQHCLQYIPPMSTEPLDSEAPRSDALTNPISTGNRCQVIPADGEPPCPQPADTPSHMPSRGEVTHEDQGMKLILCVDHHNEHKALYFTYKAAGHRTKMLEGKVARECNAPNEDCDRDQLDEMISTRQQYTAAIIDELEGRESHRKRFYAQGRGSEGELVGI